MQINTRQDYLISLERFEEIFQAKHGTKESIEADDLAYLIKEYEETHFAIEAPNPSL